MVHRPTNASKNERFLKRSDASRRFDPQARRPDLEISRKTNASPFPFANRNTALSLFIRRERQLGRLSLFNNAAYRGSWCKSFSRGSTFVVIRPTSRCISSQA